MTQLLEDIKALHRTNVVELREALAEVVQRKAALAALQAQAEATLRSLEEQRTEQALQLATVTKKADAGLAKSAAKAKDVATALETINDQRAQAARALETLLDESRKELVRAADLCHKIRQDAESALLAQKVLFEQEAQSLANHTRQEMQHLKQDIVAAESRIAQIEGAARDVARQENAASVRRTNRRMALLAAITFLAWVGVVARVMQLGS